METNPFRAQREAAGRRAQREPPPEPPAPPGPLARAARWVAAHVEGRNWWVRAPLLAVLAWILSRHLSDPMYASIFGGINLGFHEAGHAAFMWTGHRLLTTAGGTLFEWGIPIAAGAYLLVKQHDPFGAAACVFWLGTALVGSGVYASDARAQALPLVSPFGPVDVDSHDWTVMLMKYGMLTKDQAIGAFLRRAGILAMIASIVSGAWVLRIMAVEGGAVERDRSGRESRT